MATQSNIDKSKKPVALRNGFEDEEFIQSEGLIRTAMRRIRQDYLTYDRYRCLTVFSLCVVYCPYYHKSDRRIAHSPIGTPSIPRYWRLF